MIDNTEIWMGLGSLDILTILAGVSALLLYGSFWFVFAERRQDKRRDKALKAYVERMRNEIVGPQRRGKPKDATRSFITKIVHRLDLLKSKQAEAISIRLTQAGYRTKDALIIYLFGKLVLPLSVGLLVAAILFLIDIGELGLPVKLTITIAFVLVASYLPDIIVRNAVAKRRTAILFGLPDALDLMVICAEAGLGLEAALKRVSGEIEPACPEFADELSLTAVELGFLPERRQALENLAKRTNMQQVRSVVNTLIQSERYGTPLAQSLRILADEYRDERMMKAEEKAAKLPAVLTVPMIVFILPSLFVVLLGPAIIKAIDGLGGL